MNNSSKWPCSQCTYLNYVNAIKCTMCGISKSSTLICGGDDIYELGLKTAASISTPTSVPDIENKWMCPTCTYLNYNNSLKCIQCLTQKQPVIIDQMKSLSIKSPTSPVDPVQKSSDDSDAKKNDSNETKAIQNVVGAGHISPRQHSPKENLEIADQNLPSYKWRCRGCTYENWPRSTKCVMCATPKGSIPVAANSQPARLATPPPPTESKSINAKEKPQNKESCTIKVIQCEGENESKKDDKRPSTNCESINEINKSRSEIQAILTSNQSTNIPTSSAGGLNRTSPPLSTAHSLSPQTQQPLNLRQTEGAMALNNYETERILRQLRRRLREADWVWLNACIGVVEGNYDPVQTYLSSGGDPMRQLTKADVKILARPSAFDEGHTLVHLAIRFGREDLLATILSRMDGGGSGVKRVPAYVAPDLATDIRRQIGTSIRQRKGNFACHFVTEISTFSLPADVEELPSSIQEQLFEELLDRDAQKQLEEVSPIINWSLEITDRLGSRLYALWNRTAGDCLLDSLLQAAWGVFDRESVLRRALADSLSECAHIFYPRWKEYERWQARLLNYYVSENQILEEWAELVCLASQPGSALEQLHIFVLAHVLRRPVIVYGVKCVKSFRGEDLGFARFEGVYLPFLWENSFCWKSPLALGYTRGHFSALVPMEPESLDNIGAGAILDTGDHQVVFLPLMTQDGKLLPVHFLTQAQIGCEEEILRSWMEVCVTEGGILVAQQHISKPPLAVAQMTQEWLNHYRRLAQMECAPFSRPISNQGYSSDGDSEEE
ncbi:UNVERIFIED_CONTAM: hypothetical protein RMT77_009531 [Armadillidium vulgare]